jgi:uncharacterized protein (DUF736 family)
MATIATLTQKPDSSLEGQLATLSVSAPIALVRNTRKSKDNEPDYRVVSRRNGFELGAGWNRTSKIACFGSHSRFWQKLMRACPLS